MVEKNQIFDVTIQDMGINGEGIAKIDGYTVFIKGAITGEKVKIKIVKANKDFGFGKLMSITQKSQVREEPICPSFGRCGGCDLQHMNYEAQLHHKLQVVKSTLKKQLGYEPLVDEIIGMGVPYYYRNKAQYPVQDGKIGFYSERSHEIIANEECFIQNKISDRIAKKSFDILMKNSISCYNEETGEGTLRHIITRVGVNSGDTMLILVTNGIELKNKDRIINEIIEAEPRITSIIQNVNIENTNVIMGEKCITLYGTDYITDSIGDYTFKISPMSFYQVNPSQTEVLYENAKELAKLNGTETVFDLYCGIGTISIFIANSCKKVYGVEVVPQAIENAKENAMLNKVDNAEFFVGEVETILPQLVSKGIKPDVVFVDPPRKGCDEETLKTIMQIKPSKMVYISCNPATLARDLKILTENCFEIQKIKLVDMFPQSTHCECICALKII